MPFITIAEENLIKMTKYRRRTKILKSNTIRRITSIFLLVYFFYETMLVSVEAAAAAAAAASAASSIASQIDLTTEYSILSKTTAVTSRSIKTKILTPIATTSPSHSLSTAATGKLHASIASSIVDDINLKNARRNVKDRQAQQHAEPQHTLVALSSKSYITAPTTPKPSGQQQQLHQHTSASHSVQVNAHKTQPLSSSSSSSSSPSAQSSTTTSKLAKRAGQLTELKQKKLIKDNANNRNRTREAEGRTKHHANNPVDHIPDSSGHVPYRIGRPLLPPPDYGTGSSGLGSSGSGGGGSSSGGGGGGGGYHTVPYETEKWHSDYWDRDYNKNFDLNSTRVQHIEAECQDDYMKIRVGFNGSFSGLVYSAGYAYDPDCMYINGSGRDYYEFYIQLNRCGTLGKNALHDDSRKNPTNFMWNTVTVQYNPLIEEEYDEHFKVTCEYGYDFWKTVTFPFLDVEVATGNPVVFTLSPPECYMEIQNGYGIGGPRVTGPVRVGDPLTLIIYMRSKYDGFDIVVNDCYAHNGATKRIQLIDEYGCPVDDKLISRFRGSWSDTGVFETQVYAYMKTFRFTGSPALYIECDVRMCHGRCPSQPCHWRNLKAVTKRDISNMTAGNLMHKTQKKGAARTSYSRMHTNTNTNTNMSMMTDGHVGGEAPVSSYTETDIYTDTDTAAPAPTAPSLSENVNLFQSLRVLQEGESDADAGGLYTPSSRRLGGDAHQTCLKTTTFSALTATFSVVLCLVSAALMIACSRLKQRNKQGNFFDSNYITHKGQID